MPPARAQTWTARSGVERTIHEATVPPHDMAVPWHVSPKCNSFTKKVVTSLMSIIVLGTGSSDRDDIPVCGIFLCKQQH